MPTGGKRVVILHDAQSPDETLAHMVARCRAALAGEVTIVNLHDLAIKGSCQGCLLGGADNQCVYDGKDDYREFHTETVMTADFQGANLVGLVSDEAGSAAEVDGWLDQLMARAVGYAASDYRRPQTFLGVGAMKIFRDDVYGRLRLAFPADHRAYQRMGVYKTFPQADLGTTALNLTVAPLLDLPPVRKRFSRVIKTQMVAARRKVVARAEGKREV